MPENYNALYTNSILMSDKGGGIGGITYLLIKIEQQQAPKSVVLQSVATYPADSNRCPSQDIETKKCGVVASERVAPAGALNQAARPYASWPALDLAGTGVTPL